MRSVSAVTSEGQKAKVKTLTPRRVRGSFGRIEGAILIDNVTVSGARQRMRSNSVDRDDARCQSGARPSPTGTGRGLRTLRMAQGLAVSQTEVGHSRYQVAFEYAKKSLALAQKADDVAKTLNPPVVDEDEQ
jgi:hypothetical protein